TVKCLSQVRIELKMFTEISTELSCTGGKTSDFVEFARVLRGRRVTIDTFGVPATPEIVHDLQSTRWGGKTIWDILVDAGVQMTENAGCAACLGGPVDTFGRI